MPETTTTLANAMKVFYGPRIVSGINNRNELSDLWQKRGMEFDVGGVRTEFPFHSGRNSGVGAVGNSKKLPVAGNQTVNTVQIPYRNNYIRVRLEGQIIKQTETNKMAFVRAMEFSTKNAIKDGAHSIERQLWANGVGIMARVSGSHAAGATTVQLKSPLGVTGTVGGGRYLQVNDNVVFVRNATPTSAADADIVSGSAVVTISSIASDGSSMVVDAAVGATLNDNDMVVLSPGDLVTESSVNQEVDGLLGGVDDGTYRTTYHNVNRSTVPQWSAKVKSIAGDFQNKDLVKICEVAFERYGMVNKLLSHSSVRNAYFEVLTTLKRFVSNKGENADLGFVGVANEKNEVEWSGRPWRACRMAPYGMIFGINTENLSRYVNCDFEWIRGTVDGIFHVIADYDLFEARGRIYDNYHVETPTEMFRLDDINAEVEYVQL